MLRDSSKDTLRAPRGKRSQAPTPRRRSKEKGRTIRPKVVNHGKDVLLTDRARF